MLLSILERRKILQPLMRPLLIVEVDPRLCRTQELSQRVIGTAISHCQLERANKAFGVSIVGGCACPAHRENKALSLQQLARLRGPILLPLLAMPDLLCHLE